MRKFDEYCKAQYIIRVVIVVISLIVFFLLLGGGPHYDKINPIEMQTTEILQIAVQGYTYSKDFGSGLGQMAFERNFNLDSGAADKFEKFQLWDNNPDLKVCYGRYEEQDKLYPDATTNCRIGYISKVGKCDEKAVDGLQVSVSEYDHDVYIEDTETRKRAARKARARDGLADIRVIGAFGIFVIGVLVALTTKEKRACYLVALSILPFIIVLGAIGPPADVVFDDWVECKDMEDLRYYGSEPASICYTKSQYKLSVNELLSRNEAEKVDARCSRLSKSKCVGDCEWVANNAQSVAETPDFHRKKALIADTCRSKLLTGYNVWECDDLQKAWWEASGLHWLGASRKRLNKAVRSTDGASLARVKAVHNNFKLSMDMCVKKKSTNCAIKFEYSVKGCTNSFDNVDMCSMTTLTNANGNSIDPDPFDIVWGPSVQVWEKLAGHPTWDPNGVYKDYRSKWAACTAEDIAYVELAQGFKKKEKDDVPLNCLSNQDGGQRSKFMDRRLNRKQVVDIWFLIYILLMVVYLLLIFALLMFEIKPKCELNVNTSAVEVANYRATNNQIQMTNQPVHNIQATIPNGVVRRQLYQIQAPQENQTVHNIQATIPNRAVPGQIFQIQTPQETAPGQIVQQNKSGQI